MIVGYTSGVFDLFHIGHLNILRNAKQLCDKLIVGVTTDELLLEYKRKKAVIPFGERCEVVRGIRYVDVVVSQGTMDKMEAWRKLKFNVLFVGDDWYNTKKWKSIESDLNKVKVKVVYFPYTQGTSSTLINHILIETREEISTRRERLQKLLRSRARELNLSGEEIDALLP
jgi:glycerol-3-phosphate cytidylyltransferase